MKEQKAQQLEKVKKITDESNTIILDYVKNDSDITIREIKNNMGERDINLSVGTIYNVLHKNNFNYKNPIYKPYLTDIHKRKKLEWASRYQNHNWNTIIFSDKSTFLLNTFKGKKWMNNNKVVQIK